MDGEEEPERREFCYQYRSNGVTYRLNYPVPLPYEGDLRELAIRLVGAHKIPCHLEDELCAKLQEFVGSCTLEVLDAKAENNFFGGSVFEKVSLLVIISHYHIRLGGGGGGGYQFTRYIISSVHC